MRNPLVEEIEQYLYDVRTRWDMPGFVDERIVIVDIDERSLAAEGHFPWQRDKMARLVDTLFDFYHVRLVAFDMVFAEREETTALQLIEQLRDLPPSSRAELPLEALQDRWQTDRQFAESMLARDIILGFAFKHFVPADEPASTGVLPPPTVLASQLGNVDVPWYEAAGYVANFDELQASAAFGAFFSYPRLDDVIRRTPLLQAYDGNLYETLGLAAARLYLGNPPLQLEFAGGEGFTGLNLENVKVGERRIPVDERTQVYIPFRGPQGSFPYVSATDVLHRTALRSTLRDRLVIIGTTSVGLLDLRATPIADGYAGVEIHANLASGILDGRFMHSPPYISGVELVLVIANLLLMMVLLPIMSPMPAALTVIGLLAGNVAFNAWLWRAQDLVLPLATTLVAILVMAMLQITHEYFVTFRRRTRLGRIFGQYIPSELVEEIDTSGGALSLEGENREMSVLFSDVRGFTTISENLDPPELSRFMNEFLTHMTRIIHDHRGTIDKYMGDAVMAFWGAPLRDDSHAEHAVTTALAMVDSMTQLSDAFAKKGWPPVRIGIGISSGRMSVGNMGSRFRMAYTVMGDAVNLGSRLEGRTGHYGVDILISEGTAQRLEGFTLREIDLVQVKGKTVPARIYEPLGPSGQVAADVRQELEAWHEALALYRARDFQRARLILETLRGKTPLHLYDLYLLRINAFLSNPPPDDWNGVFVASDK